VEILVRALESGGVDHALGGALALAYCTLEPRATGDIDVNVFVAPAEADAVFAVLPEGVAVRPADRTRVVRDGQVRLWWDETPVDLFFAYHGFHHEARGRVRDVPFGNVRVRVLDCADLVVFKALFGRSRDWVDIEAMAEAGTIDAGRALRWLADLLGSESDAYHRLAEALVPRRPRDEVEAYRRAFGRPPGTGST
jgi:hypothetical protein